MLLQLGDYKVPAMHTWVRVCLRAFVHLSRFLHKPLSHTFMKISSQNLQDMFMAMKIFL